MGRRGHQPLQAGQRPGLGEERRQLLVGEAPPLGGDQLDRLHRAAVESGEVAASLLEPAIAQGGRDRPVRRRADQQVQVPSTGRQTPEDEHPLTGSLDAVDGDHGSASPPVGRSFLAMRAARWPV